MSLLKSIYPVGTKGVKINGVSYLRALEAYITEDKTLYITYSNPTSVVRETFSAELSQVDINGTKYTDVDLAIKALSFIGNFKRGGSSPSQTQWGEIAGEINNQTDLINLIESGGGFNNSKIYNAERYSNQLFWFTANNIDGLTSYNQLLDKPIMLKMPYENYFLEGSPTTQNILGINNIENTSLTIAYLNKEGSIVDILPQKTWIAGDICIFRFLQVDPSNQYLLLLNPRVNGGAGGSGFDNTKVYQAAQSPNQQNFFQLNDIEGWENWEQLQDKPILVRMPVNNFGGSQDNIFGINNNSTSYSIEIKDSDGTFIHSLPQNTWVANDICILSIEGTSPTDTHLVLLNPRSSSSGGGEVFPPEIVFRDLNTAQLDAYINHTYSQIIGKLLITTIEVIINDYNGLDELEGYLEVTLLNSLKEPYVSIVSLEQTIEGSDTDKVTYISHMSSKNIVKIRLISSSSQWGGVGKQHTIRTMITTTID